MQRKGRYLAGTVAVLGGALAAWLAHDLTDRRLHDMRKFDGREVGRIETGMWRSYYGHQSARLFAGLVELLQQQYHLPFWRATLGAFHAARAAVVFQRGHSRSDYEQALPDLVKFYGIIRQNSLTPFDVNKVSELELEWWIVHRERSRHTPAELAQALADLQAAIYREAPSQFEEHGETRAEAMLIRDAAAESGSVSDAEWSRIRVLLERSWTSLETTVSARR